MSDGARDAAHGLGARRDLSAHLSPPSPSRPWRTIDHAVVVGFLAVLVVPSTLFLTGVRPPEIENRPLLTPPPITVAGIVDPAWYQDVDRYVSDNLALRAPAVRAVAVVENEILGGTSNPEVIRGAGSWLFAAAEMRPTCELSAADVLARVDQTAEALQATGRPFRFLPIPDKHAIYPEAVRQDSPVPTPCTDLERPTMQLGVQARSAIAIDGWALLAPLRALDPTLGIPLLRSGFSLEATCPRRRGQGARELDAAWRVERSRCRSAGRLSKRPRACATARFESDREDPGHAAPSGREGCGDGRSGLDEDPCRPGRFRLQGDRKRTDDRGADARLSTTASSGTTSTAWRGSSTTLSGFMLTI